MQLSADSAITSTVITTSLKRTCKNKSKIVTDKTKHMSTEIMNKKIEAKLQE